MRQKNKPVILYKYRNWDDCNHKRMIINNELYFPSVYQLNDPFDVNTPFKVNSEELTKEKIISELIRYLRYKRPLESQEYLLRLAENEFDKNVYDNNYWSNYKNKVKEDLKKIFGIFSLCRKKDNYLLWSYYANSHKGFCIGFDVKKLLDITKGFFKKVTYSPKFPEIPIFEYTETNLDKLIFTKSSKWSHEKEYRIVKRDAPATTINIKDEVIKEIVFGCKMNKEQKQEIIELTKTKEAKIKLFDCVLDDASYNLKIIPCAC